LIPGSKNKGEGRKGERRKEEGERRKEKGERRKEKGVVSRLSYHLLLFFRFLSPASRLLFF
jgi:hypothetical protein